MAKDYRNKPMSEWTEADYAAEAADHKEALAGVASQMEAELSAASKNTEQAEAEKAE